MNGKALRQTSALQWKRLAIGRRGRCRFSVKVSTLSALLSVGQAVVILRRRQVDAGLRDMSESRGVCTCSAHVRAKVGKFRVGLHPPAEEHLHGPWQDVGEGYSKLYQGVAGCNGWSHAAFPLSRPTIRSSLDQVQVHRGSELHLPDAPESFSRTSGTGWTSSQAISHIWCVHGSFMAQPVAFDF